MTLSIVGIIMASTEEEINALVHMKIYRSKDDIISDAFRALLKLKPNLKIEIAIDLYRNEKVSLWRAAEIGGLSLEEFKEILSFRSIKIESGEKKEETQRRLINAGVL